MRKIISKILLITLLASFIIPRGIIDTSYAQSNTWDFTTPSDYTISDSTIIDIVNGVGELKYILSHESSLSDGGSVLLNGAYRIDIDGNYAYLSANISDAIEIIDISNPSNPTHASSISNGDGGALLDGPRNLIKSGNYLYIASNTSDAIEIIDISNPLNPTHASSISDGGTTYLNGASGLYLVGNYLYVTAYVDDALEIIDISDPSNPTHVGSLRDTSRLNGAQNIVVVGNYAYITSDRDDSLQIINISDPSNPTFVSELTNGSGGALLDGARGLDINGNYAFITSNTSDSVEIVDISNPLFPSHYSNISNGGTTLLNAPRNIKIDGDYAYVTSRISDAIEVINITDIANPTHYSSITNGGTTLLNGAIDLKKSGNYIYVASELSDALEIISSGYSDSSPNIIANTPLLYSGSIDKITTVYGAGNQGNVTYQISKDNGVTWYYLNGTNRISTSAGVINSNTPTEINSEIQSFNGLSGGTGEFIWKAFLISNGTQKVEISDVKIDYTSSGINDIIDFETPGGYTVTEGTFTRVTSEQYEGTYSIESGNNTNNSTSCFEINKSIFSDSEIKFYRKVDSEPGYDFLRFYIDGTKQDEWAGTVAWGQVNYSVSNGNHTFAWCYEKDQSLANGQDKAWVDYIEIVETNPVVNIPVLDFEIDGGYTVTTTITTPGPDWIRQTTEKYEGSYAIESQNTTDNTTTCFERTQEVTALDTGISFYKKISSEVGYDYLIFSIDGVEQDRWAGELDWNKEVYNLTPATYILEWCYLKDQSVSNGSDKAWVDIVTLIQDPPIITEVTPIITPTNDNTPDYTFNSPVIGTISYSGSCTSSTNTGAVIGDNTITFDSLADGIYTDCSIQVLTLPQNSNILPITNFTIDTTGIDVTINSPLDGSTIANGDFDIDVSYSDSQTGVNTGSIILEMYKWDGFNYGSDIASSYIDFSGATISDSQAIYTASNPGAGQYKLIFTIEDNIGNDGTTTSVFNIANGDLTPPTISSILPGSGSLIPNSNFDIDIEYSDASGINTFNTVIELKKWEGTVWGDDISTTYIDFLGSTVTGTGANYPVNKLGFGKYKIYYYIEDTFGNGTSIDNIFYIDEPELIINTGSISMGTLSTINETYSPEIIITVKTVGAGFDIIINKTSNMENIYGDEIIDWDGSKGIGYDSNPYSNSITLINTDEILINQPASINTSGDKNEYIYRIKIGSLINSEQIAGDYQTHLDFRINLGY